MTRSKRGRLAAGVRVVARPGSPRTRGLKDAKACRSASNIRPASAWWSALKSLSGKHLLLDHHADGGQLLPRWLVGEMLVDGRLDVAILFDQPSRKGLLSCPLAAEELYFVTRPDHGAKAVTIERASVADVASSRSCCRDGRTRRA